MRFFSKLSSTAGYVVASHLIAKLMTALSAADAQTRGTFSRGRMDDVGTAERPSISFVP